MRAMYALEQFGPLWLLAACAPGEPDDASQTQSGDADTDVDADADADSDSDADADTDSTTPGTSSAFSLTLTGSGFDPLEGKKVAAAVHDESDLSLAGAGFDTIISGQFAFPAVAVIEEGHSYFVDYFVDLNGDQRCEPPPGPDQMWHLDIAAVVGDVTLDESYDLSEADPRGCNGF